MNLSDAREQTARVLVPHEVADSGLVRRDLTSLDQEGPQRVVVVERQRTPLVPLGDVGEVLQLVEPRLIAGP